jgi:hypothetical protein
MLLVRAADAGVRTLSWSCQRIREERLDRLALVGAIPAIDLPRGASSLSQSFIRTGAVLFGGTDVGASSAGRGRGDGSNGVALGCGGTPVSGARGGSGGGGRSPRLRLNQSPIADSGDRGGGGGRSWAWAETQAKKKGRENVAALNTVTRTMFAPQRAATSAQG